MYLSGGSESSLVWETQSFRSSWQHNLYFIQTYFSSGIKEMDKQSLVINQRKNKLLTAVVYRNRRKNTVDVWGKLRLLTRWLLTCIKTAFIAVFVQTGNQVATKRFLKVCGNGLNWVQTNRRKKPTDKHNYKEPRLHLQKNFLCHTGKPIWRGWSIASPTQQPVHPRSLCWTLSELLKTLSSFMLKEKTSIPDRTVRSSLIWYNM